MEKIVAEYLAQKVIEDVRSGNLPAPELSKAVCHFPLIDLLRKHVTQSDWDNIYLLCESQNQDQRTLGRALLVNIMSFQKVRQYLEQSWQKTDLTFMDRIGLQFTLLNYKDLSTSFHEILLKFTMDNWNNWLKDATAPWADGQNNVLDYCQKRLDDQSISKSKRWIYICGVAATDNIEAAKTLVESYLKSDDPFLAKVSNEVMSRIRS